MPYRWRRAGRRSGVGAAAGLRRLSRSARRPAARARNRRRRRRCTDQGDYDRRADRGEGRVTGRRCREDRRLGRGERRGVFAGGVSRVIGGIIGRRLDQAGARRERQHGRVAGIEQQIDGAPRPVLVGDVLSKSGLEPGTPRPAARRPPGCRRHRAPCRPPAIRLLRRRCARRPGVRATGRSQLPATAAANPPGRCRWRDEPGRSRPPARPRRRSAAEAARSNPRAGRRGWFRGGRPPRPGAAPNSVAGFGPCQ